MEDKIVVYGNYMYSKPGYGGQITKTRNVFYCLKEKYGSDNVIEFNMEKWKKHPFSTIIRLRILIKKYKQFVILPGDNNLKFLLKFLKRPLLKTNIKVHYMVVGGWLFDYLCKKKNSIKTISRFAGIYVETIELLEKLKTLGLKNVFYSPVFSLRKMCTESDIQEDANRIMKSNSYYFCTFSRVLKEKGISNAIEAVANLKKDGFDCYLHIYGALDQKYKKEFESILNDKGDTIRYCGFIDDDKVIDTLRRYHFMIFPTYYYGEGFPATLLEANMSGLPVLASNWKYNKEIIIDGFNGFLFNPNDTYSLYNCILKAIKDKTKMIEMRKNSFVNSHRFTPDSALSPLFKTLEQ